MSNFLNKIPVSPITSFGNPSVPNGSTIGTNFSILQTGGFMEVYTLSGLTYTIPPATTGIIEFSGNSIPIQFTKGSGSVFSPDVLTLNSDNISSGRRKLGMLTYVYETKKIYQYNIDNYDTLWNNATGATGPGGSTVVISNFGTTVKNNSAAGIALINAWTASTISGVDGYDDTNASWRVLSTGGGTSVTGGTFNNNTDTLTLNNSTGGTITITGFTDYYTTGFTFNPASYDLTIKRNDGLPDLSVNLSILSSDVTITGGTYNSSTGTATFTNNTGGTFNVTGFLTGFTDIYVTGGTFNNNNQTLTLTRNDNANVNVSGFTDVFVTGGTYSGSTIIFTNNSGGTFNVTGITSSGGGTFTGGTVTGATIFTNGLTANTISATTYQNLPTDIRVTGGTKTGNNVVFTNNTGGTFTITGFTDTFVTGATYSNNTFTYRNNTGGTFSVLFNTMTGLTATTISATTYQNLPSTPFLPLSGGTVTGQVIIKSNSNPLVITTDNYSPGSSGNILYFTDFTGSTNGKAINSRSNGGGILGNLILQELNNGNVGVNKSTSSALNYNLDVNGSFGATSVSATTYLNLPTDIRVTGGTYSNGTATFTNNTGGTFNVTGLYTGGTDVFVTGATYSNNTFTYTNNTGGTFSVLFNTLTGLTVNGNLNVTGTTTSTTISATTYQNLPATPFLPLSGGTVTGATSFTGGLTANTISATTYQNLPTDIRVTGGTYSNGTATFTNNTGGTFNVTGLYTGGTDVFVTGATKSGNVATFTNNTGGTFTLTGLTDTFVTGGTYDTGSSSITFTNNSGGTFSVTGITSSGGGSFTGGTVSGATIFTGGLTANTISATTITSPSISPYGLIVATSIGYQNIF